MRVLATGLVMLALSPGLAAQTVTLEPSDALRCMTPPESERGEPEYPFEQWKAGRGAALTVEMEFTGPDEPPEYKFVRRPLKDDDRLEFEAAVHKFIERLRVPCLDKGQAPVRIRQEYVFVPDQRKVHWLAMRDLADAQRLEKLACVAHVDKSRKPDYPTKALRDETQGRVLAEVRYVAADRAPEVKVHARPDHRVLAQTIEDWLAGLRMPCFSGEPIQSVMTHSFRIKDTSPVGFKPLLLRELMASVRGIKNLRLEVDTTTMDCPFDVRFQFRQPHLPNQVGELGTPIPARRPLLEWLAGVDLDLPSRVLDAVYGDDTTVSVPCAKIDLRPKG